MERLAIFGKSGPAVRPLCVRCTRRRIDLEFQSNAIPSAIHCSMPDVALQPLDYCTAAPTRSILRRPIGWTCILFAVVELVPGSIMVWAAYSDGVDWRSPEIITFLIYVSRALGSATLLIGGLLLVKLKPRAWLWLLMGAALLKIGLMGTAVVFNASYFLLFGANWMLLAVRGVESLAPAVFPLAIILIVSRRSFRAEVLGSTTNAARVISPTQPSAPAPSSSALPPPGHTPDSLSPSH